MWPLCRGRGGSGIEATLCRASPPCWPGGATPPKPPGLAGLREGAEAGVVLVAPVAVERALVPLGARARGGHDPGKDQCLLAPGVVAPAPAAVARGHLSLKQERAAVRGGAQPGDPF